MELRVLKDTEYLFAHIEQPGVSTIGILAEELPKLILNLEFPKKMRWGDLDINYPRPIRWILALFNDKVIPFTLGDISSGRHSYGHAQLKPKMFELSHPKDYLSSLRKHFVLADVEERKQSILKQLASLEKKLKGHALELHKVLPQVLHITEWPRLTFATFNSHYLKAPPEVLISENGRTPKILPRCR